MLFLEMSGKLYTYPDNFRADKIRAVANISGYKLDVASEYTHGVTNKTPEFQAKFFGKVNFYQFQWVYSRVIDWGQLIT